MASIVSTTSLGIPLGTRDGAAGILTPSLGTAVSVVAVGDSTTAGSGDPTGAAWVGPCNDRAVGAGLTVTWKGPVAYPSFPAIGHYGNSSWTLQQMIAGIPGVIATYSPDIIMIMGGRNNMESDVEAALAPGLLTDFLDTVYATDPTIRIGVLQITPSDNAAIWARTQTFRSVMQASIEASDPYAAGLVPPLNAGASTLTPMSRVNEPDGTHPDRYGYTLIGDNAFVVLCQLIGIAPVFVR